MGISIIPQGGLAISVAPTGFTKPITSQTMIIVGGHSYAPGTSTLYTVPAGKTFYCSGIDFGINATNTNGNAHAITVSGGGAIVYFASDPAVGHKFTMLGTSSPIFKAAAGTTIDLALGGSAGTASVAMWGWIE